MFTPSRRRLLLRLSRRLSSSPDLNPNLSNTPNPNPNPNPSVGPNPNPNKSLGSTVRSILREHDLDKLVVLFKKHSERPTFRSKQGVYDVIFGRLAAAGRRDLVELLLEDQERHVASSEGFAARLMLLYGRARMPGHATAFFGRLQTLGCPRSTFSFNALLTALSLAGDTNRIAEIFKQIPSQDPCIIPNTISYNILIRSLCEKEQYGAALKALDLMGMNGVEPSLISFNTILNALYQNGRLNDAEKVWERMSEEKIEPNIWSFNAKLRGLVVEKQVLEAMELVEHIKSVGLKPDTYSYNALIKGYCEDGNLEEAKRIYKDMGKNGCAPNRLTFEMLVSEFSKAGELDMALKLCQESIIQRCCVQVRVIQEVVDGLTMSSKFEEAKKLVVRAKLKSYARKSLRMPLPCLAV